MPYTPVKFHISMHILAVWLESYTVHLQVKSLFQLTDQTAQIHRLIYSYAVHIWQIAGKIRIEQHICFLLCLFKALIQRFFHNDNIMNDV